MAELRHFTFMESWLNDMEDWTQEEKNEALWRIINYGIYRESNLDDVPKKEQAWYKNCFRVIDKGGVISETNSARGSVGGVKNQDHDHSKVEEALLNGCSNAKQVAEYIEGPGASASWVYKDDTWKNRERVWKDNGIPLDSNGKPQFFLRNSNGIPMESVGKSLDSNGKSVESIGKVLENSLESNGKWNF